MIVNVLLPLNLNKPFTYSVPKKFNVNVGDFVEVPFLTKKYIGLVFGENPKIEKNIKLKNIGRKILVPPLKPEVIKFIKEFALYNLQPIGLVYKLFLYKKGFESLDKSLKKIQSFDEYNVSSIKEINYNADQKKAVNSLKKKINYNHFSVSLLHGVTGSGKTLIYVDVIKDILSKKKQVLILLPEKALTEQISRRFEEIFKNKCAIWHSGVKDKIKKKIWKGVFKSKINIIIGARSSIFLPFQNLGLTIIDEEHDMSYKQEEGLVYNARDMVILMASILKFPIILATATPTIETYYNTLKNKYNHIIVSKRFNDIKFPDIKKIKVTTGELSQNKFISNQTLSYTNQYLNKGKQVLFFLNRRGFATYVICYNCNKRAICPNCNVGLVYHRLQKKIICHYCDFETGLERMCLDNKNCDFKFYGIGVEKLLDEIKQIYPKKRIIVISSDIIKNDDLTDKIKKIENNEVDIIVATQMISKGFNFPSLNCIVVVNADNSFFGSDIRSTEKNYQLLHQLSGRAGRFDDNSIFILQTYEENNKLVKALLDKDIHKFYNEELDFRKQSNLPPFSKLISLIVSGPNQILVQKNSILIKNLLPQSNNMKVYGPVTAPISKIKSNFRSRILIKYHTSIRPQILLKKTVDKMKKFKNIKVDIDVDPINFM